MQWGGEYEASSKAKNALFASLPLGYLAMFIITVLLFSFCAQSRGVILDHSSIVDFWRDLGLALDQSGLFSFMAAARYSVAHRYVN